MSRQQDRVASGGRRQRCWLAHTVCAGPPCPHPVRRSAQMSSAHRIRQTSRHNREVTATGARRGTASLHRLAPATSLRWRAALRRCRPLHICADLGRNPTDADRIWAFGQIRASSSLGAERELAPPVWRQQPHAWPEVRSGGPLAEHILKSPQNWQHVPKLDRHRASIAQYRPNLFERAPELTELAAH